MSEHEIITETLKKLLSSKPNDAIKLMAYDGDELLSKVGKLDLRSVVEMKKGSNGTFEMKLINKLDIIKLLSELNDDHRDSQSEATRTLIAAIESSAEPMGCDEPED